MKINKAHCLFEQSGTFKNELKALGVSAEDYDIMNDFGETDHVVDLFSEIDKAYEGQPSIFDSIEEADIVFAFFPCTRFEARIPLEFRGQTPQQKNWSDLKRLEYSMKLHEELHDLYMKICKLFSICLRGGWKMIVENPYTQPHYLTMYFPIKPTIIDKNRHVNGDYFNKPTQYWFVNCEPEDNVCFEPLNYVKHTIVDNAHHLNKDYTRKVNRSLIHRQYANRFIKRFVLDTDGKIWCGE